MNEENGRKSLTGKFMRCTPHLCYHGIKPRNMRLVW